MPRAVTVLTALLLAASGASGGLRAGPGPDPADLVPRFASLSAEVPVMTARAGTDGIRIVARKARLEEALQAVADSTGAALAVHCQDPALVADRRDLEIAEASVEAAVLAVVRGFGLDGASVVVEAGAPAADGRTPSRIHVYPPSCTASGEVRRAFLAWKGHPLAGRPAPEIPLSEIAGVLAGEGPGSRGNALGILALRGAADGLGLAADAIDDPNPAVTEAAARTLLVLGLGLGHDREAAAAAIDRALRQRPYFELLRVLARLDAGKAWWFVEPMLASTDDRIKAEALRTLSLSRDPRGLPWLHETALAADDELAAQAAVTIGLIGGADAAERLGTLLAADDPARLAAAARAVSLLDADVRGPAEAALARRLRQPDAPDGMVRALFDAGYLDPVRGLLVDPGVEAAVKVRVLALGGQGGTDEMIEAFAVALDDPAAEVRLAAVEAMIAITGEPMLAHFLRAIRDPDPRVRAAAATGLGGFWTNEETVPALEPLLDDPDAGVRKAAIDAFAALGKPSEAIEAALRAATASGDAYVAEQARMLIRYWRLDEQKS